jgi:signal transduction histidine kinase
MVNGNEPWMAEQAARDVQVLTSGQPGGQLDLAKVLADVASRSPLEVSLTAPAAQMLPAEVALALSQSVGEALANVARHSGVSAASVVLDSSSITVTDRGRGFDPTAVGPHRRGISLSIVQRMAGVGGSATIESQPGSGTTVRLVWP